MNRKIKFRAWDKKKLKFDYGEVYNLCLSGSFLKNGVDDAFYFKKEDRFILQQYVGTKDKNGVEIYEGDVCKILEGGINDDCFEVVWNNESLSFMLFSLNKYSSTKYSFISIEGVDGGIEVDGNIFENGIKQ